MAVVGEAFVAIRPEASQFPDDLAASVEEGTDQIGTDLEQRIGEIGDEVVASLGEAGEEAGAALSDGIEVEDVDAGGAFDSIPAEAEDAASQTTAAFDEVADEIQTSIDGIDLSGLADRIDGNLMAITGAGLAAGAGMESFARTQGDTNATIGRMSAVTSESEDSIRSMLDSMTDFTFTTADAADGMEVLSKRGVTNREEFEELLPLYDSFADATGQELPDAIDKATRGLGAFGIPASESAEHIDTMTFLSERLDVEMDVLGRRLGRVSSEMADLDLSLADGAAGIKVFTDRGMNSRDAMNEFRDAVKDSDGDMDALLDNLGLTAEEWEDYQAEVEGAAGMTDEFASINNDAMTPLEQMSANLENLMTRYGGLADVAGAVAMPLIALGPISKGVSTAINSSLLPALGRKVAALASVSVQVVRTAATMTAQMATAVARTVAGWVTMATQSLIQAARMAASWVIAMGPVGWVIAAVVGLVALIIANWDKVVEWTRKAWDWVVDKVVTAWEWVRDTTMGAVRAVVGFVVGLYEDVTGWVSDLQDAVIRFFANLATSVISTVAGWVNRLVGFVTSLWQTYTSTVQRIRDAVIGFFADLVERVVSTVAGWVSDLLGFVEGLRSDFIDTIQSLVERAVDWFRGLPGRIWDVLQGLPGEMWQFGKDIIQGLIDGISNMVGDAKDAVGDVVGGVKDAVTSGFGLFSPSRDFADYGEGLIAGLARGIDDDAGEAIRSIEDVVAAIKDAGQGAAIDLDAPSVGGGAISQASSPAAQAQETARGRGPLVGTLNVYSVDPRRSGDEVVRALRDRAYLGAPFDRSP